MIDVLTKDFCALNAEICTYEEEIEYLEEVLVNTNGPMDNVVKELSRTKDRLKELRHRQSNIIFQIMEINDQKI